MTEHPHPYPIDDIEDALDVLEPDWADKLAAARKALTAGVGLVAQLVQAGVLHGTAQSIATGVIGVATALGVYTVQNVPLPDAELVADVPPPSSRAADTDPDGEPLPVTDA